MISALIRRNGVTGVAAGLAALGALVMSSSCAPSAPATAAGAKALPRGTPAPIGALPAVTVMLKPTTRASAERTGYAWYVTSVQDPARGNYTAAVERRSLTRLWFDVADDAEQRASITVVLRDGRPTDLILSIDHGLFVCAGEGRGNSCALRVSIDDAAARPVRFSAVGHRPVSALHLAGGQDARRLLAAIAKAKRLRIQPTFRDEGSPEIEFALNGLDPAIAKLMKRSVAAMPTAANANPGA